MFGQKAIRKRPLFHAPSVSSEAGSGSDKHSIGRGSITSKKSGALSRKSVGSELVEGLRPDSKWLKPREYLLLVIEAALSLAAYIITERNLNAEELARVGLTKRQAGIYMIYAEGYSALVSVVIGCLADSYFRHYTVALFSVILHFAAVCAVFMESTIKINNRGNPYAGLVWNVCTVSLVLIRSSDFTRLVYGLEGMFHRKRSTIYIFVFLHFWVSSYGTYGGIIVNMFSALVNYTHTNLWRLSFATTGISLFLFVYFLYPEVPKKENHGLGCRVVGCLLLASYYKTFRIKKRGKRGFLGQTEGKYDKTTISRTREILFLYALILPSVGVIFFTVMKFNLFFITIWERVKNDDFTLAVGLTQLARTTTYVSMLLAYFGLWPLLTLIGVKNRATIKFLVGHLLAVITMFYGAILMKELEIPHFTSSSGFVRIFNTRVQPVQFLTQDRDFTTHDFSVDPKKAIMVAYPCSVTWLFAIKAVFNGTMTNFTTFLSVSPDTTTGYMILDPPEIIRIRGPYLPLREGPPGTDRGSWPRVYIYNTAETLQGAKITIRFANQRKVQREVVIEAGIMATLALEPASYEFGIPQADIDKEVKLEEGGVYGVMIYATSSSSGLEIDTVVDPNTASYWPFLGFYFISGLAVGIGYPTIRGIVFSIAPHGLTAMAFSYLVFLEGVCAWIGYIGFSTWHYHVTSVAIFAYSFGVTFFFFLCMFVLIKFKDSYV